MKKVDRFDKERYVKELAHQVAMNHSLEEPIWHYMDIFNSVFDEVLSIYIKKDVNGEDPDWSRFSFYLYHQALAKLDLFEDPYDY